MLGALVNVRNIHGEGGVLVLGALVNPFKTDVNYCLHQLQSYVYSIFNAFSRFSYIAVS